MTEPPVCECHGVAMYWHREKKPAAGGRWRCIVRKREMDRTADRTKKRTRDLRHYHAPNGGYIRRRRRELAGQRARITEQLTELEREADYRA